MPRKTIQKRHLDVARKIALKKKKIQEKKIKVCMDQLKHCTQEKNGVSEVLKRLKKYGLLENKCGWDLRKYPSGYFDSHIKRINASQMYQVSKCDYMQTYQQGYGDREKNVKEDWMNHFNFNKSNFAEEVSICTPKYPLFCGRMDGIINTNKGHVIIEFKGVLKKGPLIKNGELKDQDSEIQQVLFYSFLNNWKDVLLVYGTQENKKKMWIHTKFFNFSKTKPFKDYFENSSSQYFLNYFTKNILIWKLIDKRSQQILSKNMRERIKKRVENIVKIVKNFQRECIEEYDGITYPDLDKVRFGRGNLNLKNLTKFK